MDHKGGKWIICTERGIDNQEYAAHWASKDVLFWPYSGNGSYNCKFGYRFLKEQPNLMVSQQFSSQEKHFWKALWALNLPQKLKNISMVSLS